MQKVYKNALIKMLSSHPVGLEKLDIIEDTSLLTIKLRPYGEKLSFNIEDSDNSFDHFWHHYTLYRPKFPYSESHYDNFHEVTRLLNLWLDRDVRGFIQEQEAPDLLGDYLRGATLLAVEEMNFDEDESFTPDQKAQIRLGFEELKLLIANNYASDASQQALVISRLNYLSDGLERLNKTDWKGIFISTVLGIITTLSLDTQRGNELFDLFVKILHIVPTLLQHNMQ